MGEILTDIIFVRHAQSVYGDDDRNRPLTAEGLLDRQIVIHVLKNRKIDAFLCSPYKRSIDTIKPAADLFKMDAFSEILGRYKGKTVVIGTHGTALSTILQHYNRDFCLNDFLRIVNWMPYIIEMKFDGEQLTEMRELAYVDKTR